MDGFGGKEVLDFLIDEFDWHTPAGQKRGMVDGAEAFSTIVWLEIQFMSRDVEAWLVKEFFKTYMIQNNWIDDKLWVNSVTTFALNGVRGKQIFKIFPPNKELEIFCNIIAISSRSGTYNIIVLQERHDVQTVTSMQ